jgi:hypothetical protein
MYSSYISFHLSQSTPEEALDKPQRRISLVATTLIKLSTSSSFYLPQEFCEAGKS